MALASGDRPSAAFHFGTECDRTKQTDQVWITTSGIFTVPPFLAALALLTFGIDRILFSVDYPYAPNERGRAFLQSLSLSPADLAKLAHGNADRLLRLKVAAA